jgi:hypothetical protein
MSNFLNDLFSKVFKNEGRIPVNHKENYLVKDSEAFQAEQWAGSPEGLELMGKVYTNYHLKRIQIEEAPQVHVLESKYAYGFAVTYDEPLTKETFSNLFLTLGKRVLALGYFQVSLDRKIEEVNEEVKTTEKFYFKPPIQNPLSDELLTQLYGNISIEKISINNQPNYLKVLATYYSDRLYQDPKPFDQFLDQLFSVEKNG